MKSNNNFKPRRNTTRSCRGRLGCNKAEWYTLLSVLIFGACIFGIPALEFTGVAIRNGVANVWASCRNIYDVEVKSTNYIHNWLINMDWYHLSIEAMLITVVAMVGYHTNKWQRFFECEWTTLSYWCSVAILTLALSTISYAAYVIERIADMCLAKLLNRETNEVLYEIVALNHAWNIDVLSRIFGVAAAMFVVSWAKRSKMVSGMRENKRQEQEMTQQAEYLRRNATLRRQVESLKKQVNELKKENGSQKGENAEPKNGQSVSTKKPNLKLYKKDA